MNLLMISGKGARETALGKKNAFFNTLEELHKYFDRIDVICGANGKLFDNVFFHDRYSGQRADVMTVHEYTPFRNGRMANKIWLASKIPMLFEVMHIPGVPRAGDWREAVARIMTRFYIARDVRHAAAVRVINRQVGKWLVSAGVPAEKIKLIPAFYIDLEIFKPMNIEKKYDLLFVGRRAANKGIGLFQIAVNELRKTNNKLRFLIVDGWAKNAHELARLYNQSRLLIMPSYNEGGPRVVLEALACGTPVLATPVGIVPEILPPECIIDWSANDIIRKTRSILSSDHISVPPLGAKFEKKSAIQRYAEALKDLVIHR